MPPKGFAETENVSRETFLLLERYVALLQKWSPRINLIGKSTESEIWNRHIADSWQLAALIPSSFQSLADFGSGGGLPGLILAIAHPSLAITLVEQDQRKAAFLREAAALLELKQVQVANADIRTLTQPFEIITARALASLSELCALSYPLLCAGGICLFPKGKNFAMELEEGSRNWRFTSQVIPSKTQEEASIISISELSPASPEGQATP
jgi:16S rRNA (guanine527-N7)-methyltransferase